MIIATLLPPNVVKEVRAILWAWIGCLAVVLASWLWQGSGVFYYDAVAVFGLGSIGLGALTIGHEYTNKTLPLLLTLPADRRRLLLIKIGVLAIMLAILGGAAWASLDSAAERGHLRWYEPSLIPLGIASGLFIAPWFTMLTRSPLAGLVLTATVPAGLWFAGDMLGIARHGVLHPAEVARVRTAVLVWGTCVASVVAATVGWRTFMRLEAIEGGGAHIQLPTFGVLHADTRRSHVSSLWLLLRKELRLQQLAFVVAAIYLLIWTAISIAHRFGLLEEDDELGIITFFYLAILSVLIGALASAEERHLGTHGWHLLLPMAAWKQWTIKAGTAFLLTGLLGFLLPGALWFIDAPPNARGFFVWELLVAPVFLTACGLYMSSLCRSGVTALLLGIPAIVGGLLLVSGSYVTLLSVLRLSAMRNGVRVMSSSGSPILGYSAAISFVTLLLLFAFQNHRVADVGRGRIWLQILGMVLFLVGGFMGIVAIMYSSA